MRKAALWHERAGQSLLKLPPRVMGPQERAYYALVEYRAAVQDYARRPQMRRAGLRYLGALENCLKTSKEGYSHEMIFAGFPSARIGLWRKAAGFFAESAAQLQKESEFSLAREMFETAEFYLRKLGSLKAAKVMHERAIRVG